MVGAVPGEEALGDVFAGVESGCGGCSGVAQRPSVPAVPGRRAGMGVWLGGVQAGPLPVEREHVRVHLPHLSDEHGPLAGRHKALYVSEDENQALPAGSPAGGLGAGVRPVVADAILPQVILKY